MYMYNVATLLIISTNFNMIVIPFVEITKFVKVFDFVDIYAG
jgi:hypothetical protein